MKPCTKRIKTTLVPVKETIVADYTQALFAACEVFAVYGGTISYHFEKHRAKHSGFQTLKDGKRFRKYTPAFWKVKVFKLDKSKLEMLGLTVKQHARHFEIIGDINLQ